MRRGFVLFVVVLLDARGLRSGRTGAVKRGPRKEGVKTFGGREKITVDVLLNIERSERNVKSFWH